VLTDTCIAPRIARRGFQRFPPIVQIIAAVALGVIVWYSGDQIMVGAMTLRHQCFRLVSHVHDVAGAGFSARLCWMQTLIASRREIFKLIDTPPEVHDRPMRSRQNILGEIESITWISIMKIAIRC